MRALFGRRQRSRDERGAVTPFVVCSVIALFAVIGLVVDGGGKIRSLQTADSTAQEAARAAGQSINIGSAVSGDGAIVDGGDARRAAEDYLRAAGVEGHVDIINGTRLKVTVTTHYKPVFLGLAGLGETMTSTGTAEVRLVRGSNGTEIP